MIKLTYCLRRRSDLSVGEFQRYWLDEHGPLVRSRAETIGVRRYVQCHTLDLPEVHAAYRTRNDDCPEPFDGVAQLWFDSVEAMTYGKGWQEAASELLADERNFVDLARSPMWLGVEHEIIPGDAVRRTPR